MQDRPVIANGYLTAVIRAVGAEMCSLKDAMYQELLWQAGPTWPRHAPVLFPVIGEMNGHTLRHAGREYPMGRHGFARDRRFAWLERTPVRCRLVLHDDAETRKHYPWAFKLEIAYALDDDALEATTTVANTGRTVLPASAGMHPAFQWPLAEGLAKQAHAIAFARPEPSPIRRLNGDGLLLPDSVPTPIAGDTLRLDPALFDADAIILPDPASNSLRYGGPGTPQIEVSWSGYRQLGIWSRGDSDLLCIEPWHGTADPAGFTGDFESKPGLMHIPPGEKRALSYRISIW
jgi:galactose mutarotase-like enzyme